MNQSIKNHQASFIRAQINDLPIPSIMTTSNTPLIRVEKRRRVISTWPTDTYDFDFYVGKRPLQHHTVFLFVPGNPGCSGWYVNMLKMVLEKMGVGYAVRACSSAGHGIGPDVVKAGYTFDECSRDRDISWTIKGQTVHKLQWIDSITEEWGESEFHKGLGQSAESVPRIIFLSHSIGSHLVQRICVLRPDILLRTITIIHLMPFFRFDPYPKWKKTYLSTVAQSPELAIWFLRTCSRIASMLPTAFVNLYLEEIAGVSVVEDRELARGLLVSPDFARNFLTLGLEEIRDVPEAHDLAAMNLIGRFCAQYIFFCGDKTNPDQWCPKQHMEDLEKAKAEKLIPQNVFMKCDENLLHAFVVYPSMIGCIVEYICDSAQQAHNVCSLGPMLKSKL